MRQGRTLQIGVQMDLQSWQESLNPRQSHLCFQVRFSMRTGFVLISRWACITFLSSPIWMQGCCHLRCFGYFFPNVQIFSIFDILRLVIVCAPSSFLFVEVPWLLAVGFPTLSVPPALRCLSLKAKFQREKYSQWLPMVVLRAIMLRAMACKEAVR